MFGEEENSLAICKRKPLHNNVPLVSLNLAASLNTEGAFLRHINGREKKKDDFWRKVDQITNNTSKDDDIDYQHHNFGDICSFCT